MLMMLGDRILDLAPFLTSQKQTGNEAQEMHRICIVNLKHKIPLCFGHSRRLTDTCLVEWFVSPAVTIQSFVATIRNMFCLEESFHSKFHEGTSFCVLEMKTYIKGDLKGKTGESKTNSKRYTYFDIHTLHTYIVVKQLKEEERPYIIYHRHRLSKESNSKQLIFQFASKEESLKARESQYKLHDLLLLQTLSTPSLRTDPQWSMLSLELQSIEALDNQRGFGRENITKMIKNEKVASNLQSQRNCLSASMMNLKTNNKRRDNKIHAMSMADLRGDRKKPIKVISARGIANASRASMSSVASHKSDDSESEASKSTPHLLNDDVKAHDKGAYKHDKDAQRDTAVALLSSILASDPKSPGDVQFLTPDGQKAEFSVSSPSLIERNTEASETMFEEPKLDLEDSRSASGKSANPITLTSQVNKDSRDDETSVAPNEQSEEEKRVELSLIKLMVHYNDIL
jgi:hypothetical protein